MFPVLFEIPTPWGALPVFSYGVMLGTSLMVAWYVVMYLGEKYEGLDRDLMANTFMVTAGVAIACSRILYVATNPDEFTSFGQLFALRSGGLVAYGGFLGGVLGAWGYLRFKTVSLAAWADVCAPALGLGLGCTRIGCYLFGCDFGGRLDDDAPAWLANLGTFPHWADDAGSPAYVHHVAEYGLPSDAGASYPVHPTQIYESVFGFVLFGVAMWVFSRRHFRGQVILTVTILYAIWRFLIEYVRDDPERGFYFGFSTSQLISMALVPFAMFLYMARRKAQGSTPFVSPEVAQREAAAGPSGGDDSGDGRPADDEEPVVARSGTKRRKKRRR